MNKNRFSIIALAFITFSLVGCSTSNGSSVSEPITETVPSKTWEYDTPVTIKYDCLGGDGKVMPILGFWSAPTEATINGQYFPNMKNDEYFQAVKDSGVNLLMQCNDDAAGFYDEAELTLDFCDKYGLGYFVTDSGLINDGVLRSDYSTLKSSLEKYARKHKSFAGLYVKDEPRVSAEKQVNECLISFYQSANELQRNIHAYSNMFPYIVSSYKPNPLELYPSSLNNIYDNVNDGAIAYDIYPLMDKTGIDYEKYYTNLTMVKKVADDKKIVWAPFVSVTVGSDVKLPDEGELSWETNVYLALGAKSIYYFPINAPISFYHYIEDGKPVIAPFDFLGNKTEVYYYMKEVNKQIAGCDEYLMMANNHGILTHGNVDGMQYLINGEVIQGGSFRELTSIEGNSAIIGCFDYYGKTMLYAVNDNMHGDAKITLNFDNRYDYDVIQRGVKVGVKGKKINLELSAGESALILLK